MLDSPFRKRIAGRFARYLLGVLVALAAVWLRLALVPWIGPTGPYLTVFPAVLVAGFYLGIGPGLLASVLGVLLTERFLIEPVDAVFQGLPGLLRGSIVFLTAVFLGYVGHRKRAERELSEVKEQLDADVADMLRLHELSTRLTPEADFDAILREILEAAVSSQGSTMGCLQLVDPQQGAPHMEIALGCEPGSAQSAGRLQADRESRRDSATCCQAATAAGQRRERIVVEDVGSHPLFAGRLALAAEQAGWRAMCASPLFSRTGEVLGTLSVCFRVPHRPALRKLRILDLYARQAAEIIERKRAETALRDSEAVARRRLAELESVYAHAPIGLAVMDADLRWLRINNKLAEINGFPPEEHLGKRVGELLPQLAEQAEQAFRNVLSTGCPKMDFEVVGETPAQPGVERVWRQHLLPLRDEDGTILGLSVVCHEITEQRRAEQALRESDRRKDEFLALLGHELRNPLAAISSALQLLDHPLSPAQERWVRESLQRQTQQLCRLVDDLLDISRIARGKIQLKIEPVDLGQVLRHATQSVAQVMAEKRHQFTLGQPPERFAVMGDLGRLQQIVVNLLTNSAKYTDEGGAIRLQLERDGDNVLIRVRDNGCGIPPALQETIFELYGQIHSAAHRPQQGLGIGLSLVKKLVEAHGGNVWVHSEGRGKGSEFVVRLPALPHPVDAQPALPRPACAAEPSLDVLLVEDNPAAAKMLALLMEDRGHRVRIAADASEALELVTRRRPELILLDIGLPGMNGYELAEELRQDPQLRQTLIVATTGYGQESDRQRSRAAGIDHHLIKPVDYNTLAALIAQWRHATPPPPVAAVESPASPNGTTHPVIERRRSRILVIDDTRLLARMTQTVLEQHGHDVQVATDGIQGLALAKAFRPELILCDLDLPGMSGYDLAAAVRADTALQDVLLVAVTGHAEESARQRAAAAGFQEHIVKPMSLETLNRLLDLCCSQEATQQKNP